MDLVSAELENGVYFNEFSKENIMSEEHVMENSSEAPIVEEEDISIPEVLQESDVEQFGIAKDENEESSIAPEVESVKKLHSF
ncbi:unnamed protein product [Auanema sp. JU1783]|nr:unnamed protein product [Auanema sp. JU1783]